eukprot:jgi/Bigna1/66250/fgenesh1_pg.1_\
MRLRWGWVPSWRAELRRRGRLRPGKIGTLQCRSRSTLSSIESAAAEGGDSSSVQLSISNPALLLNNVSHRYATLSRILMEYIDNAIDDKEEEHRLNGRYLEPLQLLVDVKIDKSCKGGAQVREIAVRDNARGMARAKLMRLLEHIGESEKKLTPWLNGQFGFGMHAFRAAAEQMVVRTRHEDDDATYELNIHRMETSFRPAQVSSQPLEHASSRSTGTEVILKGIDPDWARELLPATTAGDQSMNAAPSQHALVSEIELHFERLLSRENLSVKHQQQQQQRHGCPFISRRSKYKQQLWSHPQLVGYIERNGARERLYKELYALEDELFKALNAELEKQGSSSGWGWVREVSLDIMENVLDAALYRLVLTNRKEEKGLDEGEVWGEALDQEEKPATAGKKGDKQEPSPSRADAEGGEENDPRKANRQTIERNDGESTTKEAATKNRRKTRSMPYQIVLRELPETSGGQARRYQRVGSSIEINTQHPDFQGRVRQRRGRMQFNERLSAYLANVITASYKDVFYEDRGQQPDRGQIYDDMLRDAARLEQHLKRQMPRLQRELEKVGKKAPSGRKKDKA